MSCVKRALMFIGRKKTKTFLLFMIFVVSTFTIMGAWSVRKASAQVRRQIKENSDAKVTLESLDTEDMLNDADADGIAYMENVVVLNRVSQGLAYADGFAPVDGGGDGGSGNIQFHGYDDMAKDSPFEEQVCRIVEGRKAKGEGEIVINHVLAECRQIKIGDVLSFADGQGQKVSAEVVGLYLTGIENSQTDEVFTENRMENQIYASCNLVREICGVEQYEKVAAYVGNPDCLEQTAEEMRRLFQEKAEVRTLDTVYQKVKYSVQQAERVAGLIFALMLLVSVFMSGSLLCMWMRNRKTEIAVYRSMGIAKGNIFCQMFLECALLYMGAICFSALCGFFLFPGVSSRIAALQEAGNAARLSGLDVALMWGIGTGLLMVLVGIALVPYFRKQLKNILSEMEG